MLYTISLTNQTNQYAHQEQVTNSTFGNLYQNKDYLLLS